MNNLTEVITNEIKRQYRSVRQFAISNGVPQTTIVSALKKGIDGTSYVTVLKILDALNIEITNDKTPIVVDDRAVEIIKKYNKLDEYGRHTVETVVNMEYNRCTDEKDR